MFLNFHKKEKKNRGMLVVSMMFGFKKRKKWTLGLIEYYTAFLEAHLPINLLKYCNL